MRAIVENGHIRFSEQTGNGSKRATKSTVEKHCVLAAEEFCDLVLEFAMQIGHSRKHRGTASTQAVRLERLVGRGNYLGMVGETEIIIRTEVDNGLRLAVISN